MHHDDPAAPPHPELLAKGSPVGIAHRRMSALSIETVRATDGRLQRLMLGKGVAKQVKCEALAETAPQDWTAEHIEEARSILRQVARWLASMTAARAAVRRADRRLTQEQADRMRDLHYVDGYTVASIARAYGTPKSTVRAILSGRTYRPLDILEKVGAD